MHIFKKTKVIKQKEIPPKKKGFTLIEVLVVIGIIAILAAVVLVAVNPARQFKLARDSQRVSNINAILNAIGQNMAEHKGSLVCNNVQVTLPAGGQEVLIRHDTTGEGFDIGTCVVPDYMSALPFDPGDINFFYHSVDSYNTGYYLTQDTVTGRITIRANGEITPSIAVSR